VKHMRTSGAHVPRETSAWMLRRKCASMGAWT
jgi:hypothetical protein